MTNLPPSEFGGHTQRNTLLPPVTPAGKKGHTADSQDRLRLLYLTGQMEDSTMDPDGGEVWSGLLPLSEAEQILPEPEPYPLPDA